MRDPHTVSRAEEELKRRYPQMGAADATAATVSSVRDILENVQHRLDSAVGMADTIKGVINHPEPQEVEPQPEKAVELEPMHISAQMLDRAAEKLQENLRQIIEALG